MQIYAFNMLFFPSHKYKKVLVNRANILYPFLVLCKNWRNWGQTKMFIDWLHTQQRFVSPQKSGQVRLSWVESYLGRVTEWNAEIEMKRREMFQAKRIYIAEAMRIYLWSKEGICDAKRIFLKQRGLCILLAIAKEIGRWHYQLKS